MDCYLLVGGRGRRMGRSKADLPFAGSTFLERVADAARGAFARVIAVQREAQEAPAGLEAIVEAPHDDTAAVYGVAAALGHAKARCFIVAVDYPMLTADVLRYLRERFEVTPASLLVPEWQGHRQMLCAGYDPALVEVVERRIAEGKLDLHGLIGEAGTEIIPERELRWRFGGEPLMNVNTLGDLELAERIHGQS